jgi:hypothetical protein
MTSLLSYAFFILNTTQPSIYLCASLKLIRSILDITVTT